MPGSTFWDYCFVHPVFSSFGFRYFGHLSCEIFFLFFLSCPSCIAKYKQRLCNIFLFWWPRHQKWPKVKNEKWDKRNISIVGENLCPWVALKRMVTIRYTQLLHFCDSFVANLWHGMSFKPSGIGSAIFIVVKMSILCSWILCFLWL